MRATVAILLSAATLISACGSSGDDGGFPRVVTLGEGEIFPAILNSSLAVGPNRLVFELTDADDERVLGADVRLELFDLAGEEAKAAGETAARFVPVELGYVDEQSGGAREVTGSSGAYVANIEFDHAGDWGMKLDITAGGETYDDVPFRFNVRERSGEPMVGELVPRSVQATIATVADVTDIDSSSPPRPQMHNMTIADAVAAGRPAVIAFATPAFCRTRTCAPVMDTVMQPLFQRYGNQAAFLHVEPYELRDLRAGFTQNAVPATREWRLESEPWVFVVGGDGRLVAKFEGIMALDEVEAVLRVALGD